MAELFRLVKYVQVSQFTSCRPNYHAGYGQYQPPNCFQRVIYHDLLQNMISLPI